jgi:hypothetical protein
MDTLADLFVILMFLSAFFLVLGLICEFIERLADWSEIRPRRGHGRPGRLPRRSRVARPRRNPSRPLADASGVSISGRTR